MALYALDDIDDAFQATRRFLLPFDRARWFRLAVVMFFVAGFGFSSPFPGSPTGGFGSDSGDFDTGEPDTRAGEPVATDTGGLPGVSDISSEVILLFAGLLAVLVGLFVLYSLVSAVMEFVFVRALGSERVDLRGDFRRYSRKGVRLFGFRLGVWLLTLFSVGGLLLATGAAIGGWPPTGWGSGTLLAVGLVGVVVLGGVFLLVAVVLGFTTMFVVPIMLLEDRSVLSAWRRFWPTLVGQWKQYLAYLVVNFVLGIAVSIVQGLATFLVFAVIAIPFLVVVGIFLLLLGLSGLSAVPIVVFVLLFVVVAFVALLLIRVPFQTFLRYYALLVLGDTNEDFDAVPAVRSAVRADGGDDEDDGDDG